MQLNGTLTDGFSTQTVGKLSEPKREFTLFSGKTASRDRGKIGERRLDLLSPFRERRGRIFLTVQGFERYEARV